MIVTEGTISNTISSPQKEESFISGVKMFGTTSKVYISPEPESIPEHMKNIEGIEEMVRIAKEIFNDENVHTVRNRIYIRFPEIEITNTVGERHKIYDLIVKLTIGENNYISFEGMRVALTVDEATSGYSHSHLEAGKFGKFSPFCLGSSDFNILLSNIRLNSTVTNWKILLLSIEDFISWESLEGGPYFKIRSIKPDRTSYNRALIEEDVSNNLIEKISIECISFDDFSIIRGNSFNEFLNENAKVRDSSIKTYTQSEIDNAYEEITELGKKIIWNEGYIDFRIVSEKEEEKDTNILRDDIREIYLENFESKLKEFYKKYKHEYNKKRKPRPYYIVGKTKADYLRERPTTNRLSS